MDLQGGFDTLPSKYAHIALLLSNVNHQTRPSSYTDNIIGCDQAAKIVMDDISSTTLVSIFINSATTGYMCSLECDFILKDNGYVPTISLVPILLHSAISLIPPCPHWLFIRTVSVRS